VSSFGRSYASEEQMQANQSLGCAAEGVITKILMRVLMSSILLSSATASHFSLLTRMGVAQNNRWKEIVILRSTRADVEKMMGKGEERASIVYYPIKEGSLHIEYSDGHCRPGQYRGWKVPEGTVIELTYTPFNNPPLLSSLHLDLSRFRITRESPDVPDLITYIKDDDGIAYTVQLDGTVSEIRYFPSTQYDKLQCSR